MTAKAPLDSSCIGWFLSGSVRFVLAIVKGRVHALATITQFESAQSPEDRQAGWRYFLEKTDLKPGMDPAQATSMRQMRLDVRESQAQ